MNRILRINEYNTDQHGYIFLFKQNNKVSCRFGYGNNLPDAKNDVIDWLEDDGFVEFLSGCYWEWVNSDPRDTADKCMKILKNYQKDNNLKDSDINWDALWR